MGSHRVRFNPEATRWWGIWLDSTFKPHPYLRLPPVCTLCCNSSALILALVLFCFVVSYSSLAEEDRLMYLWQAPLNKQS